MNKQFEIDVTYGQLAVFQAGLVNPFNDWTDDHVNQGFTWRDGSVSFGALSGDGYSQVHVKTTDIVAIDDAVRAIIVPFEVKLGGVEVGSISETVVIEIPAGHYGLLFTARVIDGVDCYGLSFIQNYETTGRILVTDAGINPTGELLMRANVAE